jgi:hypothetical protein
MLKAGEVEEIIESLENENFKLNFMEIIKGTSHFLK